MKLLALFVVGIAILSVGIWTHTGGAIVVGTILAGGAVLDPFGGAGTTGLVADRMGRNAILIELNGSYCDMARRRIKGDAPLFAEVSA